MVDDDIHDGSVVNHNALSWLPSTRAFSVPLVLPFIPMRLVI